MEEYKTPTELLNDASDLIRLAIKRMTESQRDVLENGLTQVKTELEVIARYLESRA